MKLLIAGYFGAGNLGDDLMLDVFIDEIKTMYPDRSIGLLKMYGELTNFKNKDKVSIIELNEGIKLKKAKQFIDVIREYNFILWVGGTCFTDGDGDGFFNHLLLAKLLGKKIGYIGIGIGKINRISRKIKTKILINISNFMSFRDKKSYEYALKNTVIGKNDIYRTEDLVYVHFKKYINNKIIETEELRTSSNDLLISWRDLNNYVEKNKEEEYINNLVEATKKIVIRHNINRIIVLPIDDTIDLEKSEYLFGKLKTMQAINSVEVEIVKNKEIENKIEIIKQAKLYICGRLHGIFISEIFGVNTIAINYSRKVEEYLKSIDKIEDVINLDDFTADNLLKLANKKNNKITKELLHKKLSDSMKNFEFISKYLK